MTCCVQASLVSMAASGTPFAVATGLIMSRFRGVGRSRRLFVAIFRVFFSVLVRDSLFPVIDQRL